MATSVTLNGVSYSIPATGEGSWGTNVSSYLIALGSGVLSKAGGSFTLTADADFGANFGLKSIYYKSRGTVATAGVLRLANAESVGWRNATNGANYLLRVNSSNILEFDGNPIVTLALGSAYTVLQMNAGATAYSWATPTGTGAPVLATSPTLVTPVLGVAAATTINKVTLTAPSSGSTLTIADGKVLTASNTLTFTGTDSSSVAFGTGGTAAYTANKLSVFAATSSLELKGVISDETGSGALVFADTPTLVTPVIGVATATSVNKMAITAPASSSTLAIADGTTFTVSNTLTLAGTNGNTMTFPSGSSTVMTLASADTITGVKTFGDGKLVLSGSSSGASTLKAPAAASTYVHTLPAATDTLVGLAASQVLTNKTLSGNTAVTLISGSGTLTLNTSGTATVPNATDTLMGKATTDVMTNKTATAMDVTGGSYINMLTQAAMRFNDDSGGEYVALKAPTGVTTHTLLLPATQGSASTTLTNDGSGNLSWAAAASATLNQYNTDIGNSSNSRTATNTNLLGNVTATTASQSYTVTSAAPGVFTVAAAPATGTTAYVTVTQNGFTANTTYYVYNVSSTTFQLCTTYANALAGTGITSSGTTAGTVISGGLVMAAAGATTPGSITKQSTTTATLTFTQSGGYSQAVTGQFTRLGNLVYMEIPSFTSTATANAVIASGATDIPSGYRPAANTTFICIGSTTTGGGINPTAIGITTAGLITLYGNVALGAFTSGATSVGLANNQPFVFRGA